VLVEAGVELAAPLPAQEAPQEALGVLMDELRAIRQELVALREDNATMREQLAALPAPVENDQAAYIARLEQLHAEAEKRGKLAMDELKRRDAEPQPRRSWWPWGRK
jgi:hypothetical protein